MNSIFTDVAIKTKRLLIRNVVISDLGDFYRIVSDDDVMQFLPDDKMSESQLRDVMKWLIGCYERNTPGNIIKFTLAVTNKDSGKLLGWCGLGPLEFKPVDIEIYYGLAKEFWGKGLATEAARAVLRYGFNDIGLKEIVAVVSPANMASRRVIEKLGMTCIKQVAGLQPQFVNYENDYYFVLTRNDYQKLEIKS